jgi:predicted amidohydrolase
MAAAKEPPAAARLRVAAVQMTFAPTIAANFAAIERAAVITARRRADVVLFPECAVTGYGYDFSALRPTELRSALAAVGQIAAACRTHLLLATDWNRMLRSVRRQACKMGQSFDLP